MWKGIAWLMLLYGLLATAVVVDSGDRQKGMQAMFGSWQQNYAALRQRCEAEGILPPHVANFERFEPLVALSGKASMDIADDGQNAWLDWTPDRASAPLDLLGIMLEPGPPDANALSFRMRANYDGQVIVGVMERDGSSYTVFPESLEADWTHYEFALDSLNLSEDSEDENGHVDVEQLDTVLVGYLNTKAGTPRDAENRVISIDDVLFKHIGDNPLFPDFEPGPGMGRPPDGAEGPMRPGERMRGRIRDKIDERRNGE